MLHKKRFHYFSLIFASLFLTLFLSGCNLIFPVLPDSVTIAGFPVGGLSKEEVTSVLENSIQKAYLTQEMTITAGEHTFTISPEQANISLDIPNLLEALFKSRKHSGNFDITPYLIIDEDAIQNLIQETEKMFFSSKLEESSYQIIGDAPILTETPPETPTQQLVLYTGIPQHTLDTEGLLEELYHCYGSGKFYLTYPVDSIYPKELSPQDIYNAVYVAPVDAVMDMESFEVSPHSFGYAFDIDKVKSALSEAQYGETISVPIEPVEPKIFTDDLKNILYRDVLSTYTAYAGSQWGRNINLKKSCEAINGITLFPGEVFSYNPALGERTPEKGWEKADGYVGNKTVSEYGGGICQASSCLYLCAMLADLEIVNRVNHGFISSYMPYGMDATVSWGGPEFLFKNTSEYPIRIEATASGGTVTVSLIGTDTKDYYVKMDYQILDTDPYETVEQELPSDNPDGYKDGDVIISPYTGYKIVTYRCKYNKATNELISREKEALSIYSRRDKVVCKIIDPEPTLPPETITPETITPETITPETIPPETTLPAETSSPE